MMRVIPEWVVEIRKELKEVIINLALKNGVPVELINDSQVIQISIDDIAFKIEHFYNLLDSQGDCTSLRGINDVEFKILPHSKKAKTKKRKVKK